jgi:hypothetical protein
MSDQSERNDSVLRATPAGSSSQTMWPAPLRMVSCPFGRPSADWFAYDSQYTGSWGVKQVSNSSNRHGAVCLGGSGCSSNRELLDLLEVVESPVDDKAAVIYTDTTIDTWTQDSTSHQLPQIMLAYEN